MQKHQKLSNKLTVDHSNNDLGQHNRSRTARRLRAGFTAGIFGLAAGAGVIGLGLFTGPTGNAAQRTGNGPAVVELFTSQGCYSCPPAEKLLGQLIENDPDLIALEFHVDYWDSLVYGSHGSHKDPFSDPENTYRQRLYNLANLAGTTGVYTPQTVINGRYASVGSRKSVIEKGIEVLNRPDIEVNITVDPTSAAGQTETDLHIELAGEHTQVPGSAHVWIAVFDIEKTTVITTGENHGKTLTSHHVVRKFNQLTPENGIAGLVKADNVLQLSHQVDLQEGQGCAVLLQEVTTGPVYGAAYCPDTLWRQGS